MALKNNWQNGDTFTPAAANEIVSAITGNVTAVKTAAYTAAVYDIVLADATAGGFTVSLPATPSDYSKIVVKKVDTTNNTVLVQRTGTDTFNTATTGPSSVQLTLPGESVELFYKSGVWTVVAHSFTVPGLDTRYVVRGYHPVSDSYSINDANGAKSLGILGNAGAVNYWDVSNSAAGAALLLRAAGADANVNIGFRPKGTGTVSFIAGPGNALVDFVPITSAVNSWRFDNSTTGNPIVMRANGNDASVSVNFIPKGSGTLQQNGVPVVTTTGSAAVTNKDLTSGTNTFPTLNQNTTGSAATLTTSRNLQTNLASTSSAGFNGSADISPGVTGTLPVGNGGTGATTLTGLVKGTGTTAMVAATAGTDYVIPGGALGTPSSGTLTNCTSLPVAGITASTSTSLGVGSVELGHASDTTISRVSAGVVAVEGVNLVDVSSSQTVSGKLFVSSRATTATAGGTTTLTIADAQVQIFTGTTGQIVKLPSTGVIAGQQYTIINNSTGNLTMQSSAAGSLGTIGGSRSTIFVASIDSPTAAADWTQFVSGSQGAGTYASAVRDSTANLNASAFTPSLTSTATAAGSTTLTYGSYEIQLFTGTTTQTCVLPTTSNIAAGRRYTIINTSTGSVTVNASGGATVVTLTAGTSGTFVALQSNPTTAAHWAKVS